MDKTNSITRLLCLSLLTTALVACSSETPSVPPQEDASATTRFLQDSPLEVGQSRSFDLGSLSHAQVSSNTNEAVASATVIDGRLVITGHAYGTTLVSVRDNATPHLSRSYEFFITGKRPVMATELFASHNVAPDGERFTATQDPIRSGFFTYNEAKAIQLEGYRLPTRLELRALFPYHAKYEYGHGSHHSYTETITLNGETKRYEESFFSPGRHVGYALRFGKCKTQGEGYAKDNSQLTAFRYEYSKNSEDPKGGYSLKITTRYLGEHFRGDISMIAAEGFWASFRWDDHTLELPATGIQELHGRSIQLGEAAEYWSSSKGYDDLSATAMSFGKNWASHTIHADRIIARPVRLIKNK